MALTATDILQILEEQKEAIRRLGARELVLFGSCARGDNSESSDLDFLVKLDRKSFDAYMDLKFFLEDLFGRKVDLVISDAVKPRLLRSIREEAIHVPGL